MMRRTPSPAIPDDLRRRILRSRLVRDRLVDYVFPAVADRSVRAVIDALPPGKGRCAVIGCGIGSLAWEVASRRADLEVTGLDSDPTSIEVAAMLFELPNLSFAVGPHGGRALDGFDAIVVADGTATSADLEAGLRAGPRVVRVEAVSGTDGTRGSHNGAQGWPRAMRERSDRVERQLGMHVTADGYLIARRPGPSVLIVMPARGGYSETFIRAHIEQLPASVSLLVGSMPDLSDEDGREMIPKPARVARDWAERLFGQRASNWLNQFWLRRHMSSRGVDVVLAEYGVRGIQMIAACRRLRIPLVTHFFGYDATARTTIERNQKGYRQLFRSLGPLVVVSRHMAGRLSEIGADPGVIAVIPCGVEPDRALAMPQFDDPPVFLAVGRFVDKKAPFVTLLAFRALVHDVPESRLRMVGDGPLLWPCMQLAKALGIQESVEFLGALPHDRLPDLYRESRAFVQHSMEAVNGDSEGLPVAILEAAVAGLPVVATRHSGIPEAVIHGETGFLVAEGAIDEMADQMRALALDPELANRLGSNGRRHVIAGFTLDDSMAKLTNVLEAAIARPPGGPAHDPAPR